MAFDEGVDWLRAPVFLLRLDCGSSFAWVYYVIFIMLVTHIMLNLFILVIIEQFDKYYLDEENPLKTF